mmetsp:Transcript_26227/g.61972  ORF Transcript_26227/g.61972 Transcript_26227/m.61972 type:complete len:209 (-) Transcript_26227:2796-3422(-)
MPVRRRHGRHGLDCPLAAAASALASRALPQPDPGRRTQGDRDAHLRPAGHRRAGGADRDAGPTFRHHGLHADGGHRSMERPRRAPHAGLNGSRGRSLAVAAHEPPLIAVVARAAPRLALQLGGSAGQGFMSLNSPKALSCSAIFSASPTTTQLCSSGLKYFLPMACTCAGETFCTAGTNFPRKSAGRPTSQLLASWRATAPCSCVVTR